MIPERKAWWETRWNVVPSPMNITLGTLAPFKRYPCDDTCNVYGRRAPKVLRIEYPLRTLLCLFSPARVYGQG